jgi:holo-[acyl-carrier protein] synthase
MILGVGVDLTPVERMAQAMARHPERLEARLFTARERAYCAARAHSAQHFAARFAAKEAVLKAFGTGISRKMRWTEVEVLNEASGRPRIRLDGSAAAFAERHGLAQLDVSLTHTEGLALAYAIALWRRSGAEGEVVPACAST